MVYLETPEELADKIADWCGVYGSHTDGEKNPCRICFVDEVTERIRKSVENEAKLSQLPSTPGASDENSDR